MNKVIYPVILYKLDDSVLIEIPDLKQVSQAKNIEEAIDCARDLIGLSCTTKDGEILNAPSPTPINDLVDYKSEFDDIAETSKKNLTLVDLDLVAYNRRVNCKSVRRNVTLPAWMDAEVQSLGINVSKALQDALLSIINGKQYQ